MPINFTRKYFKRKKLPLRPLFSSFVFVTMKTRKRNPTLVMTRFYIGVTSTRLTFSSRSIFIAWQWNIDRFLCSIIPFELKTATGLVGTPFMMISFKHLTSSSKMKFSIPQTYIHSKLSVWPEITRRNQMVIQIATGVLTYCFKRGRVVNTLYMYSNLAC